MVKYLIDTHCHLAQDDYDRDRSQVLARCQQAMRAVITCCANPKDFALTTQLVKQYPDFIFVSASIHPQYITLSDQDIAEYFQEIRANRTNLVAIGETGLDYNWVTDQPGQIRQKHIFQQFIGLAQELQLPLVIHSRDSTEDVIEILEAYNLKHVQMHMFTRRPLLQRVIQNGWMISVNTLLLRSKTVRKIVRDCPLDQLFLETDAPWLGIGADGSIKSKYEVRNEPLAVQLVADKIAEIKHIETIEVAVQTGKNACTFFHI